MTTTLLGLDFPGFDLNEAAAAVAARPHDAPFAYVVTPNADHFVRLARAPELAPAYRGAWLRLLDSRVVARTARLLGLPTPPVVTGSDLAARLLRGLPRHEPITIVGMRPGAVAALAERCGLTAPFHHDPPMGFASDPTAFAAAIRFVLDHPSRLIFLAVGSPRQELLAAAIARQSGTTGTALCIGTALDFLAGTARRAPAWVQHAGLEWAHRLAADPRRLSVRYLRDDPAILGLLLRERATRISPQTQPAHML